jgi:hypothetical protein
MLEKVQSDFLKAQTSTASVEQTFDSDSFQKGSWQPLQEKIIRDFTEMGPYWQILMLRDIQFKLLNLRAG